MKTTLRRVLLLSWVLPAAASAQQTGLDAAAATITEADYARRVGVIAHDSMRGRDTPSPELDETAAWIASELRSMGLRGGAADGGFVQRYPLREIAVDTAASGLVAGDVRLSYGSDLLPLTGGPGDARLSGDLVLLSGSHSPAAALATGLGGAHVVIVRGRAATGLDRSVFLLMEAVRDAGAGSIIVTNAVDEETWARGAARALEPSVRKGWGDDAAPAGTAFPLVQMRPSTLERLLRGTGVDQGALHERSDAAVRVDRVRGVRPTLTQRFATRSTSGPNVVGILEGSDAQLRREYVVFSAHMDHVGTGAPDQSGDSIFNGADDDASGTVAVIEVAEAMAALATPPRRSMVFLLVSGEEKGLWGSEYFAGNPTVAIDQVVANLNADMVGRNWSDTIVAIGKEHSDLGRTLERVNRAHPELGMTAIDDLWPEERFYFRSDHYNFARSGVPILFFFNGTHEDYHGRDDEPEKIDAEKAARIARLLFYLGVEIGNADERPRWNPESYRQIVGGGT